jgi:tRNA A-37 threonylcarbamoyl transferase component Bud32
MRELTTENALAYLTEKGWIGPGPARIALLGGGVSNVVLRVETPQQTFVLKQSRPQLRTRDAWFSDLERVYREQEVMQVLEPLLPPLTVPKVLFSDRENYVFAMSHAPAEARNWKHLLLEGETDTRIAEHVGEVLGRMHDTTARHPHLVGAFGDATVFVQLRVDPFYRRVQERRPEVAHAITPIIERMLTEKLALCHGDYTPKNILVQGRGFTLVDYETAYFGDPTMDLGLCLCHLLLKAVKFGDERYRQLTRAFWEGYRRAATYRPLAELQRNGIEHLGVCLLARVDGTSPVEYLDEGQREAVRRFGRRILLDGPNNWDDVLALLANS